MEKRITIKNFLNSVILSASLGLAIFAQAQILPVNQVCDASFKVSHLYAKSLPPQYAGSKFEALQGDNHGYLWDFGDGSQDTGKIVNHNFAGKGPYLVRLITYKKFAIAPNIDGLCRDTSSKKIDLNDPVCNAAFRPTIYSTMDYPSSFSQLVGFRAVNENHKSYHWDFGDGTQDTGAVVHHVLPKTGKYYVTLRVKSYTNENPILTCEATSGGWFAYNGYPTFDVDSANQRCYAKLGHLLSKNVIEIKDEYDIKTFVYDGIDVKRTWSWGDGTSEEGSASASHAYQVAGTYTVTLVKSAYKDLCFPDNPGCKALPVLLCQEKYSIEVIVSGPDEVKKCPTHIIQSQEGQTATFKDNLIVDYFDNKYIESYEWDFGDGSFGAGRNVSHTYSTVGQYLAKLKKTVWFVPCPPQPNGITCMAAPVVTCQSEEYFHVWIKCISKVIYKADGLNVLFEDSVTKAREFIVIPFDEGTVKTPVTDSVSVKMPFTNNFIWDFGDGTVDTTATYSVRHTYLKSGQYKVKLIHALEATPDWNGNTGITGMGGPCTSYSEIEINVADEQLKICKAFFEWSLDGNQVKLKSKSSGEYIGYARLDFGDGDWVEAGGISLATKHTYSKPGVYEVCLRVANLSDSILPHVRLINYCTDTYCQSITVGQNSAVNGLDDFMTLLNVSAYPNPANDKVTFNIINPKGSLDLKILDMSGYLVKEVKGLIKLQETIYVSDLNEGVYVYSFSDANGVLKNGKLIIAR